MDKIESKNIKLRTVYDGGTVTNVGVVTVKFKAPYSEIINIVKVLALVGNIFQLFIKEVDSQEKFKAIGNVEFHRLGVDRDGQSTIHFKGSDPKLTNMKDYIEKEVYIAIKVD